MGAFTPGWAFAATINVTTTADIVATDGVCSLREAVNNVNAIADTTAGDCVAAVGADTISLPAGTYTLTGAIAEDLNVSGDLDIYNAVTIQGAGAATTIIDGNGALTNDRVIHVPGSVTSVVVLTLNYVTIRGGKTYAIAHDPEYFGGGIFHDGKTDGSQLNISNSVITGNRAWRGAGANCWGVVVITNSVISQNTSSGPNAGIAVGLDNSTDNGPSQSAFTITASTISGNSGGAAIYAGMFTPLLITYSTISGNSTPQWGAGTYTKASASIINSTISGNSSGYGGSIYAEHYFSIINSTIVNNSGAYVGGGIVVGKGTFNMGAVSLTNTIVAGNPGGDCGISIAGTITSNDGNIDSDGTCNLIEANDLPSQIQVNLGALAINGGNTATHALLTGSVAIDAAPNCAGLSIDQRGSARPKGAACDIGAYEGGQSATGVVTVSISGTGSVTSDVGGISCPGTCTDTFLTDTQVSLTATGSGTTFVQWLSGPCHGLPTNPCTFTVTEDTSMSAQFSDITRAIDGDFDGDRRGDIAWWIDDEVSNYIWLMSGSSYLGTLIIPQMPLGYEMRGVGDFDGDGVNDILWELQSGGLYLSLMKYTPMNSNPLWVDVGIGALGGLNGGWDVVAVGDLDGNGHADIVWRNYGTGVDDNGQNVVWFMDGDPNSKTVWATSYVYILGLPPEEGWDIVGAGDLTGNGKADIVLHKDSTNENKAWIMNGASILQEVSLPPSPDGHAKIEGLSDLNGDGIADILLRWYSPASWEGKILVWFMSNDGGFAHVNSTAFLNSQTDLNWHISNN